MRAPSPQDLVRAWELGEGRPDWFRALLLLALGAPQASLGELAALSLGVRNTRVARLRQLIYGPTLTAVCPCPRCGAVAEFSAGVADLAPGLGEEHRARAPFLVALGDREVACRAPTSADLADLETSADAGLHGLALRCLDAAAAPFSEAPPGLAEAVVEAWYAHDPGVEAAVALACGGCGHGWTLSFDWPRFLWSELAATARRLMGEVGSLARAFGWREADVLGLGAARRRFYLDWAAT